MGFAPAPRRWRVALGLAACAALVVAGVASLARRRPLVAASASGSGGNDAALAAAALWRLRTTPAWAGRLRYGAAFLPYEAFVEAHGDDLAALRCGDASIHASGPLFFAYHRLLRREFLAAFRAVAPRGLGDVPPRPPGGHGAWDGVLGPLAGDADRGYAVGAGAFAGWPVAWRGVTHDTPAKRAMPPVLVRYDAYCGERSRGLDAAAGRAAQESEIPNFKGSDLGRFPLVSADFWTIDHLSERSRSVDAFPGTRARGTLTLKRR